MPLMRVKPPSLQRPLPPSFPPLQQFLPLQHRHLLRQHKKVGRAGGKNRNTETDRVRGTWWGLIAVLLAAGWLLETIGETAFTALVWIVGGLVLLGQVFGLLARIGLLRRPVPPSPGQLSPRDERRWQRSRQQRERGVAALLV